MYYLDHYVVDWDKVKTVDDIKRILAVSIIAFERTVDVSTIQDLVVLEKKKNQPSSFFPASDVVNYIINGNSK